MGERSQRPSVVWGLRAAWRLRRLVVVIWVVNLALSTPATIMVRRAVEPALSEVAPDLSPPVGDIALIVAETAAPVIGSVGIALVVAMILTWVFTVLWHAGVARFEVWGKGPPSVSQVLGLGLTGWWAYCRLSLTALTVLVGSMVIVWTMVAAGVSTAFQDMAEGRMVLLLAIGITAAAVIKVVVWAATLRGAWELAVPTSRSAVKAWMRGLVGVLRNPISTFGTLLILGSCMVLLAVSPAVAPILWPVLRGTPIGAGLGVLAGIGGAFLSVALFSAFAPVSGLMSAAQAAADGNDDNAG